MSSWFQPLPLRRRSGERGRTGRLIDRLIRPTLLVFAAILPSGAGAATYYVSSSTGNDGAAGTSEATAWKSLGRASEVKLVAGDQMLLRAGERFQGTLRVEARGETGREVVVGTYGQGAKPAIDGQGAEAAVQLVNASHVILQGLELVNEPGQFGVRLTGQNQGALGRVTIENMTIHRIHKAAWSRPEDDGHGPFKYFGGINIQAQRGEQPTWWEGLVIRNNEIHDLGTCGISIASAYVLHENLRRGGSQQPAPIKGVLIERNVFRDIARDGAIIRQCEGAVVQHNDVIRTGRVSMSNGLWFWDCRDSAIRFNVGTGCGVRAGADGGPFSIDYNCTNCVVEYNYTHDNEGPAFMGFGNGGTGKGSLFRGNISYNDATAPAKPGFGAVSMISTLSETVVEGNVIIAGPDTRVMLGHHDWQGLPKDVTYRANIFVGNGKAVVHPGALTGGRFDGNLFVNIPGLPKALSASPQSIERTLVDALSRRRDVAAKAGVQGTIAK